MSGLILECDLGNSSCKWRLFNGVAVVDQGRSSVADSFDGLPIATPVDRVRIASVARDDVLEVLRVRLACLEVEPEFASSRRQVAGISNAYGDDYAGLGVDRWLAIIAAYKKVKGPVLVLDAGSALTVDLVDGEGVHLGGYIAPGVRLMKASLLVDTGKVRFNESLSSDGLVFGCSTLQAVNAGVLAAQVGVGRVAIEEAGRRIGSDFAILVTGGAGTDLIGYLPEFAELVPDLVLDGLAWVLP